MHTHLLDAFGHTPVFVDYNHLGAHQTSGGVLVILEQVDDVTCLLYVVDMAENLVALVGIEFLNNIYSIVGVEVFNLFGDILGIHFAEQTGTFILIKLHEYVRLSLLVKQTKQILSLLEVEVTIQVGDVGGMQIVKSPASLLVGMLMNYFAQIFKIFGCKLFHYCWSSD